ncbi:hypothetical protein [Aestuariibaculum suncheonense]|uniref:Uncharacterized protein n=1 Tax=Aestuariibaculum suncheonense TaxID=1028745 RepID=A0A8J6QB16_9FLAO|nr:hypothetical protein [Aestuariibaculum suncheonense]MBD0836869.1 hypothetical protein [Aestuariibaculum suncheonense]
MKVVPVLLFLMVINLGCFYNFKYDEAHETDYNVVASSSDIFFLQVLKKKKLPGLANKSKS